MKKFCVIFLVFAVLGPLFSQEDWPIMEYEWVGNLIDSFASATIPRVLEPRQYEFFVNNWERILEQYSDWEEVTDWTLQSDRYFDCESRQPIKPTIRQLLGQKATISWGREPVYGVACYHNFIEGKHVYALLCYTHELYRQKSMRARVFVSSTFYSIHSIYNSFAGQ
jgi:hypothetical protein